MMDKKKTCKSCSKIYYGTASSKYCLICRAEVMAYREGVRRNLTLYGKGNEL